MNTQTGDVFVAFDEKTMEANFGKPLTLQDRLAFGEVDDTRERLRRFGQPQQQSLKIRPVSSSS